MTSRLGAAAVAAVFVVTTGITAMEAHQLAAHGMAGEPASALQPVALALASGDPTHHDAEQSGHGQGHGQAHGSGHAQGHGHHASAPGVADEPAGHADAASDRGHSGHSEHGSTSDCTCVGPCASGVPPTLTDASFAELSVGETATFREMPARVRVVPQDPRTHLLPFSLAPPARV